MEYLKKNLIIENSGILTYIYIYIYIVSTFLKVNKSNSGKNDDKKGNKGSSRSETAPDSGKTAVVFSLRNEVGGLVKALKLFQVSVRHHCTTLKGTVCLVTNLSSVKKHSWINFWTMCWKVQRNWTSWGFTRGICLPNKEISRFVWIIFY